MHKSLNSYPLPPHIRYKLTSCGYTDIDDIQSSTVEEICQETELLQEEVLDVLKIIISADDNGSDVSKKPSFLSSSTAFALLQQESQFLTTCCFKLDEILGGGIPLMKLTEICGAPGIGKTQMGLQLCINIQIPKILGGLEGEAILIDTEGSFVVERLIDIASAAAEHTSNIFSKENKPESSNFLDKFTIDDMLKNIHIYRCRDHTELLAVVTILPEFLKEHPKVRLLVIDSIAFHFRYGFDGNYSLRTRILCGLAQSLLKLASEHNLAVILTNQMTTKINEESDSYLAPSLGESWGHACTVRIVLFWEECQRKALLFKSPWRQEAVVPFQITTSGIRDVDPDNCKPEHKRSLSPTCTTLQPKKSKCAV